MSPYLTARGRWLLISGTIFLALGALLSNPLILFLGQVQIFLLAVAFMLLVPAAIALDRRKVRIEQERDPEESKVHIVGDEVSTTLRIVNESRASLYSFEAAPFSTQPLTLTDVETIAALPGRSSLTRTIAAEVGRCGRWMLHGFDVRITEPLGLIQTRDYLPCPISFEFFPRRQRPPKTLARTRPSIKREGGRHPIQKLGVGTDIRELREYQPGDPLRHIAWKATARRGKLISKNFEHESTLSVYLMLDISCSMRGGQRPGHKLEHGIEMTVALADQVLRQRDSVGLMTFDEKLYGHVASSRSNTHLRRIMQHLVGLNAVIDSDLTEFDEDELQTMVVDYLLIQERLDFRKGSVEESGINTKLLKRWLTSVFEKQRVEFDSPVLREGMLDQRTTRLRRFAQLRGLDVPYRIEARLGMKERGLVEALEQLVATTRGRHLIVIISDLCGIMNMELLTRGLRLAQVRGHQIKFVVPFTPAFYEQVGDMSNKYHVLKDLFTHAEREERLRIVEKLQSLGIMVEFSMPRS